ncbi:MAG TPA: hypothetical protein VNJ04_02770 [Gemmatimonadaceae bacterium]|nr:hypothetical protein [Gemmatimonadaceae bacterium]
MPEKKRYRVRKTDADGRPVGALSYPTDPEVEASLRKAGETGGETARKARESAQAAGQIKTVKAGEWCDDVPAKSLPWLLAQGMIEQVEETRDLQEPRKDT